MEHKSFSVTKNFFVLHLCKRICILAKRKHKKTTIMKKSFVFFASIMVSLAIISCGNKTDGTQTNSETDTTSVAPSNTATIVEIGDEQTFDSLTAKKGYTLVDFYATWCGPCKRLAPILEEVAEEMAGKVTVLKVDVDKNPVLADKFKVNAIPHIIVFKDGKQTWSNIGMIEKDSIINVLKK